MDDLVGLIWDEQPLSHAQALSLAFAKDMDTDGFFN